MAFVGVAPFDPTTPIGQTRSLVGDVQFTSNGDDTGNYGYFSDNDLAVLLLQGAQNPLMAAGFAFMKLSAQAAIAEANIATDDLKYGDTSRSVHLFEVAQGFFDRANNVEWFTLAPTGDAIVDIREYFYPAGALLPSEIIFDTTESLLFPGAS